MKIQKIGVVRSLSGSLLRGNYNFITAGMCVTALSSLHPGSAQAAARDHFHIIARAPRWMNFNPL
jgi:hypothetical protein